MKVTTYLKKKFISTFGISEITVIWKLFLLNVKFEVQMLCRWNLVNLVGFYLEKKVLYTSGISGGAAVLKLFVES